METLTGFSLSVVRFELLWPRHQTKGRAMLEARIHVTLKKSVLDPQGDTVKSGLASLGFTSVEDCRIGKFMVVKLSETDPTKAKVQVDEMCRKLLANPVIEDYVFQISEVAG